MTEDVHTLRMATGGEAVAKLDDGRVVFVRGAAPGERVRIEIDETKKRFARGHVIDVLEPGPGRVGVACPHAVVGECGGCDWLHIDPAHQRDLKVGIVSEQLRRLGGLSDPNVLHHPDPAGRRCSARCTISDGRAGYRGRRTDSSFAASECRAAHPALEELIVDGRFDGSTEVVLRVAPGTDQRLAIVDGPLDSVLLPADVIVAPTGATGVSIDHEIAGRRWRVSVGSFFQTSARGAETLVEAVRAGLGDQAGPVIDLYAGVGLLGGAATEALDTAIEAAPGACDDARHNLSNPGTGRAAQAEVRVIESRVGRWTPDRVFDAVIADPARSGLGSTGVAAIDACSATRLVLVSCDPASLGRDCRLLAESGWTFDTGTVIDMFPDTSRIEAVSVFTR